jgi:glyoxylate/hydroxypyruvate reductase A
MAEQMAEYVTLAVLAAYREQREYALAQRERRWAPRPRRPKRDFAVGLLGYGVLGRAVAAALAPFGFPLLAWVREPRPLAGVETFAGPAGLDAMLRRTRVLVVMLPSTPETSGLVDARRLSQLPEGAHLVNVARGELVVDADVVAALDRGHLASATLDVFRDEPLPPGHPFWHHPRIAITPHVSAETLVAESAAQVAAKVRALERGEPASGRVDPARGY